MRMWRNGNASPCHGEDLGPIPGVRSQGALGQLAEPPGSDPGRPGSNPGSVTKESEPARVLGLAANECAAPAVTFKSSALRVVFGVSRMPNSHGE
jgi:hypothetical protein